MRREPPLPKELWEQIPPPDQAAVGVLIESYEHRIAAVEAALAALKEQRQQNSQNSSRPSATDGPQVKRTPPRAPSGRKGGACRAAMPSLCATKCARCHPWQSRSGRISCTAWSVGSVGGLPVERGPRGCH
jgi:hypothetical protein